MSEDNTPRRSPQQAAAESGGGYTDVRQAPPRPRWCIGCDQTLPPAVSLDGYARWHLCEQCYGALRPFERAALHIVAAQTFDGGLAAGTDIEHICDSLLRIERAVDR